MSGRWGEGRRAVRTAWTTAVVAVGVAAVVGGCSVVPSPERPDWRVFTLEPITEATSPAEAIGDADRPVAVLGVPTSGAGYTTPRMAYSRGGGELEYFATHRWAEPPARLLAPLFQAALERTGGFRAVASAPTRARGDVVVESELLAFRQDVHGGVAEFRAALRVTVVRSDDPDAFVSQVLEVIEPQSSPGPAEGVRAANRALAKLLERAAEFCVVAATG